MVNILFLGICIVSAWPEYWKHINYEESHLTWFSSIQLIFISLTCFSIWFHKFIQKQSKVSQFLWLSLGGGFFFFSLDEKFQIHERLREGVFKVHEIGTNISGVGKGDFLHLIFAAIGLVFSYFVVKEMKGKNGSLWFFLCAVVISLISVVSDATMDIPVQSSAEIVQEFRAHQFTEEILETIAEALFLVSFTRMRWTFFKDEL